MSVKLYDDAIVDRLTKLTSDTSNGTQIHILPPNETEQTFLEKASDSKDKITLPLIALRRRGFKIRNANKQPKSFDGIKIRAYTNSGELIKDKVYHLNAIPILLNYQLDVYTTSVEECEDYVREFVFDFVNNPTFTITIPYNKTNVTHKFTITVEEDVPDNSDIKERLFPGQFTRYTLGLVCDDAYLFSIPTKKTVLIGEAGVVVEDRQSHEEIEKINVFSKDEN